MKHRGRLIAASALTLLPMAAGLLLWNRLPDRIATHFDLSGAADGSSSKPFAVFGIPLFLLLTHLICLFAMAHDPRHPNMGRKIGALVQWLCPGVSVVTAVIIYPHALGYAVDQSFLIGIMLGFLLLMIGNYLPKCRQNYTVGIKLPWTLSDEENWNRTHRMAGPLWMAGGFVILLDSLLRYEQMWVIMTTLAVLVAVPTLYSLGVSLIKTESK